MARWEARRSKRHTSLACGRLGCRLSMTPAIVYRKSRPSSPAVPKLVSISQNIIIQVTPPAGAASSTNHVCEGCIAMEGGLCLPACLPACQASARTSGVAGRSRLLAPTAGSNIASSAVCRAMSGSWALRRGSGARLWCGRQPAPGAVAELVDHRRVPGREQQKNSAPAA